MKVFVDQNNGAYILGVDPDPLLITVDNKLLKHRMVLCE